MLAIYSPDLVQLGLVERYSSLQWLRQYHSAGEFVLTMALDTRLMALLQPENLLVKGKEAGIIEAVHVTYTPQEGDLVEIRGRFLAGYLARRLVWGVEVLAGTPENVMRQLVTNHCTVGARAIEHLAVAPSSGLPGESIRYFNYLEDNSNLLAELETLSETYGLGFRVEFGTGLTYRVYAGLDRTADQSANPRAIFARGFENVLAQIYDISTKNTRNVTRVVAKTGDWPIEQTVGTATGRNRHETFVNAGDISKDAAGTPLTSQQQAEVANTKGKGAFVEDVAALTASADPYGNLRYKVDYDLGDIVTIHSREWGLRANVRITAVKEIYEQEGMRLEITLGQGIPSFDKQMRWFNG